MKSKSVFSQISYRIWAVTLVCASIVLPFEHVLSKPYLAQSGGKAQAAEKAKAKHGGKVLDVHKDEKGGKTVYRVKLLLNGGKVIYVTVDAESGHIS